MNYDNLSDIEQIVQILNNPKDIVYISNQSEHLKLLSVAHNGENIRYIKNPVSKVVQIVAATTGSQYRLGFKGLTERTNYEPCLLVESAAILSDPRNIKWIKNPSIMHQLLFLSSIADDATEVKYIDSPSVLFQLIFAARFPKHVKYLNNKSLLVSFLHFFDIRRLKIWKF